MHTLSELNTPKINVIILEPYIIFLLKYLSNYVKRLVICGLSEQNNLDQSYIEGKIELNTKHFGRYVLTLLAHFMIFEQYVNCKPFLSQKSRSETNLSANRSDAT